jgi:RNase P/RNase MRP subunit p29
MNRNTVLAVALGAALALPAAAGTIRDGEPRPVAQATAEHSTLVAVEARHVHQHHDLVTVSGRVIDATPDAFVMERDGERIQVRMNGWDWYRNDHRELVGSTVTVQGRVDDDWRQGRALTAEAVYANDRGRVYYSPDSPLVDDMTVARELIATPAASSFITGRVIEAGPDRLRIDSGNAVVDVSTRTLDRDPTRGEGPFTLRVGDRVVVAGHLIEQATTPRSAAGRRLEATTLVLLTEDPMSADAVVLLPEDEY